MSDLLLIIIPKEPRVSKEVIGKIADIFLNLGNIAVGSIILPFIFEKPNLLAVFWGVIFAIACWLLAIGIVQRYYK